MLSLKIFNHNFTLNEHLEMVNNLIANSQFYEDYSIIIMIIFRLCISLLIKFFTLK